MHALKRSSLGMTKALRLVVGALFIASLLITSLPQSAQAAGETYSWNTAGGKKAGTNIRASGGDYATAASLDLDEGNPFTGNLAGGISTKNLLNNSGIPDNRCNYHMTVDVKDDDASLAIITYLERNADPGHSGCMTGDQLKSRWQGRIVISNVPLGAPGTEKDIPDGCPGSPRPGPPSGPCPDTVGNADEDAEEEGPICTTGETTIGSALSYLLCPVTSLIVDATTFIEQNIIIPYLSVSPLTTSSDNAVYTLWQNIRNIANIAFIIAFFMVIFSQATSIGLSNYGIKRLLPKLAFVAIGSNLSYFIVALAVDAFNIFGAGIAQLVLAAIPQSGGGSSGPDGWQNLFAITAVGGGLALGAIVTSGKAVLGWLFSLIGIAFLILLVAVIVLVLRQMVILLLVIVSPLAFVAYLLPNTEKYFTKWRDLLIQLLMMYPLIVLLFAIGKIVAALINSGDYQLASGEAASDTVTDAIKIIMGFFAGVLPLGLLPAAFMVSGTLVGGIYRGLRQRGQQYGSAAVKTAGEKIKPHAQAAAIRMARSNVGEGASRANPRRWLGGAIRGAGWLSTGDLRRNEKEATRQRELERAQKGYVADQLQNRPGFRKSAAGVGGQAGAQRALAYAYGQQEKEEKEELDNSMAMLRNELKSRNIDAKTFAGGNLANYLRTGRDTNGMGYSQMFRNNPSLMQAALNSAAQQGEVATVEAARMSSGVDQTMVDRIIRENDGKLKEKGGYHLATNFGLAAGRMVQTNAAGQMLNAQGQVVTDRAQAAPVTSQTEMSDIMTRQRVAALSSSGANSVAGAKAGLLFDTAAQLRDHAFLAQMSQTERQNLYQRTQQIVSNPNTLNATEAPNAIRQMAVNLGLDRHATNPLSAAELASLQQTFNDMDDTSRNQLRATGIIPAGW